MATRSASFPTGVKDVVASFASAWGSGLRHGLVLPLQASLDEALDGLVHQDLPREPKGAAIDAPLAIQQPVSHGEAGMLLGVGLLGDQVINLGQDAADIEGLERPPAAFFLDGGRVIDIKIRWIGDVTA